MDYARLTPGYQFPPRAVVLEEAVVEGYRQAVEDNSLLDQEPRPVPPMAVAALALRAVLEHLDLAPGAVHASQELAFLRAVSVGEEVVSTARVAQNGVRGGWRWLSVDLATHNAQGELAMTGRSTVLLPTGE